jgi:hypothetical protein
VSLRPSSGAHRDEHASTDRTSLADHSRKARLTSTNVTTARTRAPTPSTAICGVMADKKSMAAKPLVCFTPREEIWGLVEVLGLW